MVNLLTNVLAFLNNNINFALGAREQINQITSFIDGGVVYGDTNMKWLELVDTNTGETPCRSGYSTNDRRITN